MRGLPGQELAVLLEGAAREGDAQGLDEARGGRLHVAVAVRAAADGGEAAGPAQSWSNRHWSNRYWSNSIADLISLKSLLPME